MWLNWFIRTGWCIKIPEILHIWSNKFHFMCTFQQRILSFWTYGSPTIIHSNSNVESPFSNWWSWSHRHRNSSEMWVNWHCPISLFMIYPFSSLGGTDPIFKVFCIFLHSKVKRDQVHFYADLIRIVPSNSKIWTDTENVYIRLTI